MQTVRQKIDATVQKVLLVAKKRFLLLTSLFIAMTLPFMLPVIFTVSFLKKELILLAIPVIGMFLLQRLEKASRERLTIDHELKSVVSGE